MKYSKDKISQLLLAKEAIKINTKELFRWSSGILSPIYCDNRKMLSYPSERDMIVESFVETIKSLNVEFNCIAGVATGGIAWSALVAHAFHLPLVYVRSEPKKHGLGNQIEGYLPNAAKAIVIEDLISTGGSSLNACLALQTQGASVTYLVSIFQYGFPQTSVHFQNHQIPFTSLTDFQTLISNEQFTFEEREWILNWIQNPQKTQ